MFYREHTAYEKKNSSANKLFRDTELKQTDGETNANDSRRGDELTSAIRYVRFCSLGNLDGFCAQLEVQIGAIACSPFQILLKAP
jgi:hypothetical protein